MTDILKFQKIKTSQLIGLKFKMIEILTFKLLYDQNESAYRYLARCQRLRRFRRSRIVWRFDRERRTQESNPRNRPGRKPENIWHF